MKNKPIASDQLHSTPADSGNFFLIPSRQQLYQKLTSGFHEGKILFALTGESGLGKTFLMEHITRGLRVNSRIIKVPKSNLEYDEFLDTIGKESDIDLSNESTLTDKLTCLTRCFRDHPHPIQHLIIEIDQAQKIKPDTLGTLLNWVKLINSEQSHTPYIQILLIGLPSLDNLLKQSGIQKLEKKIICQCKLQLLNDDEILDYINFHLSRTEESTNLFEANALKRIAFYSKGNPGLINKLCDLGLLTASLAENAKVTPTEIDEVAENCLLKLANEFPSETEEAGQGKPSHQTKDADKTKISSNKAQDNQETLLNQLLSGTYQNNAIKRNNAEEPNSHNLRIKESKPEHEKPSKLFTDSEKTRPVSDITRRNFISDAYLKSAGNEDEDDKFSPSPLIDETRYVGDYPRIEDIQPSSERPDRLSNKPKSTSAAPERSPKSFVMGLVLGILFSIGGLLVLNQNWFEISSETSDSSHPETNNVQPELPSEAIQIIKPLEPLPSVVQDDNLQQSQPKATTLPDSEIVQEKNQVPDTSITKETEVTEPGKSDTLNLQIDKLLNQADQQLKNKQLMTPADDNAWQTYQEILRLAPNHERALAGIDKITKTYVLWAREEVKKGNPQHAEYLFNKALEVSPSDNDALSGITSLKGDKKASLPQSSANQNFLEKNPASKSQNIINLLNLAEQQLAKKKLMTPVEDSAWHTYQEILSRDPGNLQALAGINKVADTYALWAREAARKGYLNHAEYLFNNALVISPDHQEALSGLARLKENKQQKQLLPDPPEIVPEKHEPGSNFIDLHTHTSRSN